MTPEIADDRIEIVTEKAEQWPSYVYSHAFDMASEVSRLQVLCSHHGEMSSRRENKRANSVRSRPCLSWLMKTTMDPKGLHLRPEDVVVMS